MIPNQMKPRIPLTQRVSPRGNITSLEYLQPKALDQEDNLSLSTSHSKFETDQKLQNSSRKQQMMDAIGVNLNKVIAQRLQANRGSVFH